MIRRNRPVGNIVQQLSDTANKLTKGKSFFIRGGTPKRDLDINNVTLNDLANTLSTLISDLKEKGIIQ